MTTQKQDLAIFHDNSIAPSAGAGERLLGLITHTQGTAPSWLINALIENSLHGTCHLNSDQPSLSQSRSNVTDVTVISFVHNEKFYARDLRKSGVDISERFHFIDLFTDLFSKITGPEALAKTIDVVCHQLESCALQNKTVFLEGIEFLLAATAITPTQLLLQITRLQKASSTLFVISSADHELIDFKVSNPLLPEFKTADFLLKILHRAQLNFALRPLDTGRAKDVTGTLTISRGAIPFKSLQIVEKEYLFLVTRDQQIKLFYR